MLKSRSVRRLERPNSAECDRKKLVPCDETLIKQLEAAIQSQEKAKKALDVLLKRIASGEVSDNMLLRIVLPSAKAQLVFQWTAVHGAGRDWDSIALSSV
jgi:hypothetical protein